jgi:hypothetical protein
MILNETQKTKGFKNEISEQEKKSEHNRDLL